MNLSPRTTKYVRSASCLARPSGWSDRWSWIRLDEKGRDFYEVEAQLLILYQLRDDGWDSRIVALLAKAHTCMPKPIDSLSNCNIVSSPNCGDQQQSKRWLICMLFCEIKLCMLGVWLQMFRQSIWYNLLRWGLYLQVCNRTSSSKHCWWTCCVPLHSSRSVLGKSRLPKRGSWEDSYTWPCCWEPGCAGPDGVSHGTRYRR